MTTGTELSTLLTTYLHNDVAMSAADKLLYLNLGQKRIVRDAPTVLRKKLATLSISVAGDREYSLASDFYMMAGVWIKSVGIKLFPMGQAEFIDDVERMPTIASSYPTGYIILGYDESQDTPAWRIRFNKTPDGDYTVYYWYYYFPPVITAGSTPVISSIGYDELLLWSAAMIALQPKDPEGFKLAAANYSANLQAFSSYIPVSPDYTPVLRDETNQRSVQRVQVISGYDLSTALADTSVDTAGDYMVGYKASGTGAVARTVHSRFTDFAVSVKDYGAIGDGIQDDTAAIQAAIAAATAAGRGNIYFPSGTYLVSAKLTIAADNIGFIGDGWSTILAFSSALGSDPGIYVKAAGDAIIYGNQFRNFKITLVHDDSIGISFINPNNSVVDSVRITGNNLPASCAQTGIYMDGATVWGGGVNVTNCVIEQVKFGINIDTIIAACIISNNWITGVTTVEAGSIGLQQGATSDSGNLIIGNDFEGWAIAIHDKGIWTNIISNRFEFNTVDIEEHYPEGQRWTHVGNMVDATKVVTNNTTGLTLNYDSPVVFGRNESGPEVYVSGLSDSTFGLYLTTESASPIAKIKAQSGGTGLFGEDLTGTHAVDIETSSTLNIGTSSSGNVNLKANNTTLMTLDAAGTTLFPAGLKIGSASTVINQFAWGNVQTVSDGGTIAHGIGAAPLFAFVNGTSDGSIVNVKALDETNITVSIKAHDGTAGSAQTIFWMAIK